MISRLRIAIGGLAILHERSFPFALLIRGVIVLSQHFDITAKWNNSYPVLRFAPLHMEQPTRDQNGLADFDVKSIESHVEFFAFYPTCFRDQKVAQLMHKDDEPQAHDHLQDG